MPRTKQMESRILDFPDPFKPVMALKWGSKLHKERGDRQHVMRERLQRHTVEIYPDKRRLTPPQRSSEHRT